MPAADTTTTSRTAQELRAFAQMLTACRDDAGLIDEQQLEQLAEQGGIAAGRVPSLAKQKGCVRLGWGQRLAVANTAKATAKAALLSLHRPGSTTEVAAMTGRDIVDVAAAFRSCPSIRCAARGRWVVPPPDDAAAVTAFASALDACSDDAGLLDESRLRLLATQAGIDADRFDTFAEQAGCVRLSGRLAVADTATAAVKGALLDMGRSASVAAIADAAGLPRVKTSGGLRSCRSVFRAGRDRWVVPPPGDEAAVTAFASALDACSDDAGLLDESQLRLLATQAGIDADRFDTLAEQAGCVRLSGRLASADTAVASSKAVLLSLARPTAVSELADITQRSMDEIGTVLSQCPSAVRIGRARWIVPSPGDAAAVKAFAAALDACSDDVGLIDDAQLKESMVQAGVEPGCAKTLLEQSGCVRLFGRLAVADTARAAVKAALLHLGRPSTTPELAELTGRAPGSISPELSKSDSFERVGYGQWTVAEPDQRTATLAAMVHACVDDAELIDEALLLRLASDAGIDAAAVNRYTKQTGCYRMFGRLAVTPGPDAPASEQAATKAALLHLGGSASCAEVSALTGSPRAAVSAALHACPSIFRAGPKRWVVLPPGEVAAAAAFASARDACRDDVGLLDETRMRQIAAEADIAGDRFDALAEQAGCVRLLGRLAAADTAVASAKAALMHLGRPASASEIARLTGRPYQAIAPALSRCPAILNTARGRWELASGR